ncbi:MAG: outer membrane beta-barrel family protein [Tannerellaceae bacterium]|nr:outer membrane beta-barrel family protein [Tannerellaceae bacterium]
MKKLSCAFFLSLLFTFTPAVYSQEGVNIHVVNEKDEPLGGAVVYVLSLDSLFINSILADEAGLARIPQVDFQKEILKIMAFGYNNFDLKERPAGNSIKVSLEPLNIELSEVIVKANSSTVQKNDRIIFYVANENMTKGSNSFELIKFTPLILVDQNKKLSIIGKSGVQLYINGRKTNLPETSIRPYLESLPADRIANIEVITNPGATIRTDGNQGIINLILKKNEADGLNGTLSLSDSQRTSNSQDGSLYLNYQKDKLNVSANIYGDNTLYTAGEVNDYYYIASNNHQHLIRDDRVVYKEFIGNIKADYHLSERQVLGVVLNASYMDHGENTIDQTSFGKRNAMQTDSMLYSDNQIKRPTQNYSVNLNYRFKVNEKGDFSVDADYLQNIRKQSMQTNFAKIEDGVQQPPYDRFHQISKELVHSYSGKIEYKHTFNQTTDLTAGIETYSSASEADFFHENLQNGVYVSDPQKNNIFSYNETYGAGYVSFSRVWTPRFNSRIEARLESVKSKGVQQMTSEEIQHNYTDLLPSVSLQYQFNPDNRLSYNFTSYAGRPGYYSLNPFRFFLTPSTYKEYNPALKPSYLYTSRLNYALKGHYIFDLSYIYIKDCTNNFLVPVDEQYTKYINANYGYNQILSLTFNWNESFWHDRIFINSSLSGEYMKQKGAVETILVDASGFSASFSLSSSMLISKRYNWTVRSRLSYITPLKLAHENVGPSYRFGLGATKNFNNGIALNLGIDNLFFNNIKRNKVNDNYAYYLRPETDFRQVFIGISIPFGNMKTKGATNRGSSSSSVKRRLKE